MRNLFILRGAPASGKSTWIRENELEPYTISTDGLRLMYQSPVTTVEGDRAISQNNDKQVWELLMELLERRMENGELVMAVPRSFKNENGEYDTDYIEVRLSKSIENNVSTYCEKGDLVGVKGRLESGINKMQVIADKVTFLSSRKKD